MSLIFSVILSALALILFVMGSYEGQYQQNYELGTYYIAFAIWCEVLASRSRDDHYR